MPIAAMYRFPGALGYPDKKLYFQKCEFSRHSSIRLINVFVKENEYLVNEYLGGNAGIGFF
jgi:hypothetical protein